MVPGPACWSFGVTDPIEHAEMAARCLARSSLHRARPHPHLKSSTRTSRCRRESAPVQLFPDSWAVRVAWTTGPRCQCAGPSKEQHRLPLSSWSVERTHSFATSVRQPASSASSSFRRPRQKQKRKQRHNFFFIFFGGEFRF